MNVRSADALRHDLAVFSIDAHFKLLEKACGVKLFKGTAS